MEHTSELVYEGKLISNSTYLQRSRQYSELELDGIKIDFYDKKNRIVHEVKKSNKIEEAHEWQVKYYLYVLEKNGINGAKGILEYPKLRKTEEVILSELDRKFIFEVVKEIKEIIVSEKCPPLLNSKICKRCSYFDFCYSD